ncbi:MAG: UDP-N-acetylmuramoyl-L-alanyl-D-glutamate synthetase [Candidatus Peribacteria bacterium]|nr:UDP-N-acetylmuramoyl-L-alanyl-D-glutamate synthetase [Candidatus Peribacteria bacterium]
MHITELTRKKICILGFGKEGQAMLRAIEKHCTDCTITVADKNENIAVPEQYAKQLGTGWLENLEKFDVIIKSPGIPPGPELKAQNSKLTSSTQIFLDSTKDTGAAAIGVTGSKGKSTTSSLIYAVLKAAGKDVHLVGNIGLPAIDHIGDAHAGVIFVLEMSSYQLMDLHTSPHIAVITSFFPEHLDYHGSLEAYMEAKKHITRFQTPDDIVFYNKDSSGATEIAGQSAGQKIPFSRADAPLHINETRLLGDHNLSNIAGACAVAKHLHIADDITLAAIRHFEGLPHRLQFLGMHHGIEWVDDAISTTPESTMAALKALGNKVHTIILGGQDRGYDFGDLGQMVADSMIANVILFPETGSRIKRAIEDAHRIGISFYEAQDMPAAVEAAKANTKPGKMCLLSTASPSYNMFKNFEDKGEQFRQYIEQ